MTAALPAWDPPPHGLVSPEEKERLYQAFRTRLLDEIYPLPNVEHESGCGRLAHTDLAGMVAETLREERWRLLCRLALDNRPAPWLLERRRRLEQELRGGTHGNA